MIHLFNRGGAFQAPGP